MQHALINKVVDPSINSISGPMFKSRQIPPIKNFISAPADLSIVCVSKSLMQQSRFLDSRFAYTGYLRWQSDTNDALEEELIQFCEGDAVPIISFGSVSFDHIQDIMSRFEKTGRKVKKLSYNQVGQDYLFKLTDPK
jgi:hypothetical protein